jgi:hypothetical protein
VEKFSSQGLQGNSSSSSMALCPYHRQKKIEKERLEQKRRINGSDKYKYPGNDYVP